MVIFFLSPYWWRNPKSRCRQAPLKLLKIVLLYLVPVWQLQNGLWLLNSNLCTHIAVVSSPCVHINYPFYMDTDFDLVDGLQSGLDITLLIVFAALLFPSKRKNLRYQGLGYE